jgi:hypothetical protein
MEIITVQPAKDIASRALKAFVDRGRLTAISFRSPATQVSVTPSQNVDGSISTTGIQDRILQIPVSLLEHAPHSFLDKSTLIVRGSYD